MAIIPCPECGHDVSTTAKSCPNCGYSFDEEIDEEEIRVCPLSTPNRNTDLKVKRLFLSALLIFAGVVCAFLFGIIGIVIGLCALCYGIYIGGEALKTDYSTQTGCCPYCGERLIVHHGNTHFVCPICHNRGVQTETSLETNH